jgi:hypothetical protein
MTALQWGNGISYDILVFDKLGQSAFLEVKASASHRRRWILQSKYANPASDSIPLDRRFVCCVDLTPKDCEPHVYVFPAAVVATGLHCFLSSKFPRSSSYHLSLDFKPSGKGNLAGTKSVGEFICADDYLESWVNSGSNRLRLGSE